MQSTIETWNFWRSTAGWARPVKRYMAFLKLPEAELAEGVSIDELFDVSGNPVFGAGLRWPIWGVFHVTGAACFLLQGQRGGWNIKKRGGGTSPHSLNSCVFLSLSPYSRLPDCRYRKIREDDSDPPRNGGGMRPRVAVMRNMPLSRPQGVAIVCIYPCGKARKRRPGAAWIKRRMALWNCGRTGGN